MLLICKILSLSCNVCNANCASKSAQMQESKCKSQDKLKFGFFIKFYVRRYCSGGAKDIFVDKKKKKQISLPACVTDHMPIHLHLDLPTSPTSTLTTYSQSSPPRTLYHSKRLKDKDTKEAFTRALAVKVSRITPSIKKLHAQLQKKFPTVLRRHGKL